MPNVTSGIGGRSKEDRPCECYQVSDYALSRDSVFCNQHHAEPCFAVHHSSKSIGGPFERKCLDHRTYILQNTERKGILAINRSASQTSVDRAPSKGERERVQLDLVLRHTHDDELAANPKVGHGNPASVCIAPKIRARRGVAARTQHAGPGRRNSVRLQNPAAFCASLPSCVRSQPHGISPGVVTQSFGPRAFAEARVPYKSQMARVA